MAATLFAVGAHAAEITITCGTGVGRDDCQERAGVWAESTGNSVRVVSVPQSPNEQLSL